MPGSVCLLILKKIPPLHDWCHDWPQISHDFPLAACCPTSKHCCHCSATNAACAAPFTAAVSSRAVVMATSQVPGTKLPWKNTLPPCNSLDRNKNTYQETNQQLAKKSQRTQTFSISKASNLNNQNVPFPKVPLFWHLLRGSGHSNGLAAKSAMPMSLAFDFLWIAILLHGIMSSFSQKFKGWTCKDPMKVAETLHPIKIQELLHFLKFEATSKWIYPLHSW